MLILFVSCWAFGMLLEFPLLYCMYFNRCAPDHWHLCICLDTFDSLVGSLNKIPISIVGIVLFKVPVSLTNLFSILFGNLPSDTEIRAVWIVEFELYIFVINENVICTLQVYLPGSSLQRLKWPDRPWFSLLYKAVKG